MIVIYYFIAYIFAFVICYIYFCTQNIELYNCNTNNLWTSKTASN